MQRDSEVVVGCTMWMGKEVENGGTAGREDGGNQVKRITVRTDRYLG